MGAITDLFEEMRELEDGQFGFLGDQEEILGAAVVEDGHDPFAGSVLLGSGSGSWLNCFPSANNNQDNYQTSKKK